jgi:hypothetical protein
MSYKTRADGEMYRVHLTGRDIVLIERWHDAFNLCFSL